LAEAAVIALTDEKRLQGLTAPLNIKTRHPCDSDAVRAPLIFRSAAELAAEQDNFDLY
jgi:hypothetical protein